MQFALLYSVQRHLALLLELYVFPVEPEGGHGVLGGVVGEALDPGGGAGARSSC